MDIGKHRRQELALSHAGHQEAGGLEVPRGVCGQHFTGRLPVGQQSGQEPSEHS